MANQSGKFHAGGLEGVVAGPTAICDVEQNQLMYRGYEIHDLAKNATFEGVAFLLLVGHKPSDDELAQFEAELVAERALSEPVVDYLRSAGAMVKAGSAVPMDVLRTAVSLIGNMDPESQDSSPEADLRKAKRLTAKIPTVLGHLQNVLDGREIVGREAGGDPTLGHAANLLYMMTGEKPDDDHAHIMDVSLILYAEHDYNASTFTARVITGTLSDMHGAVTGAIAALKGPLHGGANEAAIRMLQEIGSVEGVPAFMSHAFKTGRKLMGFGHRVYKNGDHRADILRELGRALAEKIGPEATKWFDMGDEVRRIMDEDKHIFPNVDFPCGMTYFIMGVPIPMFTPIFVAARVTGWCAHIMEQRENNRLIRPISEYVGAPQRPWNE